MVELELVVIVMVSIIPTETQSLMYSADCGLTDSNRK